MEIIKERTRVESVRFQHGFDWSLKERHSGFGFEVDEDGNLLNANPDAVKNFTACKTGKVDGKPIIDMGVERIEQSWTEPAEGKCHCGRTVVLSDGWRNDCECGSVYNIVGQQLTDPRTWGEETGEHWTDLQRI